MKFVKMHGLGNDFVFLGGEDAKRVEDPAALARKLCQKHFGICADGLVLILPSDVADARMRIFNPDGSEAEMCGNAMRCVGKYLYESGAVARDCMSVETLGGVKPLRVNVQEGRVHSVAADMGLARIGEAVKINLGGHETPFLPVDMGNPHVVAVIEDAFASLPVVESLDLVTKPVVAPVIESDQNVEFVRVDDIDQNTGVGEATMRVNERGCGETLSCGTGLCATGIVLRAKTGISHWDITVRGGTLRVDVTDSDVKLTGAATLVADIDLL